VRAIGAFVSYVTGPENSTMASLKARNLLLLEKSALKSDLCGVERQSKHNIFQTQYQLRGISSPP
jgi:hypothetical protein